MKLLKTAAIALAAVLSIGPNQAISAKPHPNWTATVNPGEGGSHVLGNPEAALKLTEFISYTCPHCAHFHKDADAPLKMGYVHTGKVSVEIRHLVRDKVDLAATLLANCGDPKNFFANHNMILQAQDKWIATMDGISAAQRGRWNAPGLGAQMKAIAGDLGFYAMFEQRGYRRQALDQCLSDEARARQFSAQTQKAVDEGVEGTPSFMLNGVLLAGTHDWQSLDAQLKARF